MIEKKYKCSQGELYTIARMGWKNCRKQLPLFESFKARYNEAYIAARLAEVSSAEILPDYQARGEVAETLRIQLAELMLTILDTWQVLKRYIVDAFPRALRKAKLEAAGGQYYRKASNHHWTSVQALLVSGANFVAKNEAALMANENMPASFATNWTALQVDYMAMYQAFLEAQKSARLGRQTKVSANNAVYGLLIGMFLDGQVIFKRKGAIKALFTFDSALRLIRGVRS